MKLRFAILCVAASSLCLGFVLGDMNAERTIINNIDKTSNAQLLSRGLRVTYDRHGATIT